MNERECIEVYTRLNSFLRDQGLAWVVDLAASETSLGKTLRQRSTTEYEDSQQLEIEGFGVSERAPRRSADLVIQEYTEREKLKILIDIIKQSVVDTTLMENRLTNFFRNRDFFSNTNSRIRFVSNLPNDETFDLDDSSSFEKAQSAIDLLNLLEQLKREIDSNDTER